jgi:hypothetical protein
MNKWIQLAGLSVAVLSLTGCQSEACGQAKEAVGSAELEVINLKEDHQLWKDAVQSAIDDRRNGKDVEISEDDMKMRNESGWALRMAESRLASAQSAKRTACGF